MRAPVFLRVRFFLLSAVLAAAAAAPLSDDADAEDMATEADEADESAALLSFTVSEKRNVVRFSAL